MRAAIRNRRLVPESIANLPSLRRDALSPRVARQTGIDKNPAAKPAEFPRGAGRSGADESAPAIADRTIPVRARRDEICRGERNLRIPSRADRHQYRIPKVLKVFVTESQ